MFNPIESFTLDHRNLEPGVYRRYSKGNVATWDIRFKKPNGGEYIKPEVLHTLEHFLATYFKNVLKDDIYGVFPMGCCTGFYILTSEYTSKRTILLGLLGAHSYIVSSTSIPGATEESCGNYKFQDLEGAKEEINKFYTSVLENAEIEIYEDLLDTKSKNNKETRGDLNEN